MVALLLLNPCSEPRFESAGSRISLLEDRKACVAEIAESSAARPIARTSRRIWIMSARCVKT